MNAKAKGSRNQRRSRAILAAAGFMVTRAAASLGCWDLVGIGSTDIVLCQVKTRDWPGATEIEILRGFSAPPNARKLVYRWRGGQRQPDVRQL
jgi:Holliday junction resolvase